ncbi:MAG TPA: hypothetical protein VJN72_09705 [Gaiellales bacterium]|nr:hypothetical protein [Gaiellales bacterium]
MKKREATRFVRRMILRSLEHDLDENGAAWIYESNRDPVAVEVAARAQLEQLRRRWKL